MSLDRVSLVREFGCLPVYIGQITVGYGSSWTAPIIPQLQDPDQSPLPDVVTDQQASWIGSVLFIGCIIGPYVTGLLPNGTGRKPCLLLGAFVLFLGFLMLALAKNLTMIYTGRVLFGLGTGITLVVNLVYLGEIASTHIRGVLLTVTGVFFTLGTLIVYSVGPYVRYSVTGYIGAAFAFIYVCGIIFIPESPLYLVMKVVTNKFSELNKEIKNPEVIENIFLQPSYFISFYSCESDKSNETSLVIICSAVWDTATAKVTRIIYTNIHPKHIFLLKINIVLGDEDRAKETLAFLGRPEDIDKVIIKAKQELATKGNVNHWSDVFTERNNRKALVITLSLNILQQMSGIGVIVIFITTIFHMASSSIEPNTATIIVGITQLTASFIAPLFVERSGRKTLLLISTAVCFLSLVILGTYFYLDSVESPLAASVKWLPLASLIVFFLSYDIGFGIIPGTFIGEMFTPNARSTGSTITITIGWLFGFGTSTAFGYMLQLGAHFTFWFYAAACAAAFIFTIVLVPETRGKSLAEIQEMLNR